MTNKHIDLEEKVNLGCKQYIPATRRELIVFSKQPGLRTAVYFDPQHPEDPKIKCVIVANYDGWVTAVTSRNNIIQEWAGMFHLGSHYEEVEE